MNASVSLPGFSQVRAVVIGDVMLDRYWYGNAERISPEAPVPVVRVQDCVLRAGGAANVAVNMAALGAHVQLFGLVGEDSEAQSLRDLLQQQRVQASLYSIVDHPTITKLRVLGQHQQLIRMDFEKPFTANAYQTMHRAYQDALTQADIVVLSDYAKGTVTNPGEWIAKAKSYDVPVLVDPKGNDIKRYAGAYVVTPNLKEFIDMAGPCADRPSLVSQAQRLCQQHQIGNILITLGEDGMLLVPQAGEAVSLSAQALEVFDVTGAGDSVIATLAAALATHTPMTFALQLANVAAGIAVSKLGSATVSPAEIQAVLQQQQPATRGVIQESELLRILQQARQAGERIVMTNGCFDILHAGHVQYLRAAKALGTRLIVAVNDDESVARLKGSSRPLNRLLDRMALLAELCSVDWVVPFSEDTPQRLIEAVLPDVLVKGDEYSIEAIAGAEAVLRHGGEVQTVPMKPGFSTSGMIAKIKAQLVMRERV